jgi:hypothetical protein
VVTASHDAILRLVDLVRRDFNPKADHWSLGYDVVVTALVGAAELAAVRPAAARAPLVGAAKVVAAQNRARFTTLAVQVDASAVALREAQINLRSALQSSDVTLDNINSYAGQLQNFVEIYSILRAR